MLRHEVQLCARVCATDTFQAAENFSFFFLNENMLSLITLLSHSSQSCKLVLVFRRQIMREVHVAVAETTPKQNLENEITRGCL